MSNSVWHDHNIFHQSKSMKHLNQKSNDSRGVECFGWQANDQMVKLHPHSPGEADFFQW